jgi:hypothetical protein
MGKNWRHVSRLNWWLLPEMLKRVTVSGIKWLYRLLAGSSLLAVLTGTLLAQPTDKPKRNLLFIGQAKGYQHEAISTAMATLYNLGRSSGLWNTQLRTDCTAITKKPLKWEAKNLDGCVAQPRCR